MNGIELKNNLLSKDASIVLYTAHEILHMATMAIKEREILLDETYQILDAIKSRTDNLEFGGAIMPNKRFVTKAIRLIEESKDGKCKCEFAFDGYGQDELLMHDCYGFNLYSHEPCGYINRSIIECPCCHTFYECEDEYTGWHMNTFRHLRLSPNDFKIQRLQKRYVFLYEDEETLKKRLISYGIDERNLNEPIKPPCGTIFVGNDAMKNWIKQRKCFYGWNIQFCDCPTAEISFK